MFDFERPNIITEKSEDGRYGKFVVEPLERGYGTNTWQCIKKNYAFYITRCSCKPD